MARKRYTDEEVLDDIFPTLFTGILVTRLRERGGHPGMLSYLVETEGYANLTKVADFIASLEWKVPISMVKKSARIAARPGSPEADMEHAENLVWFDALYRLNIRYLRFVREPDSWKGKGKPLSLPASLLAQVHGKVAEAALQVEWGKEPYTVIYLDGVRFREVIDSTRINSLFIAPSRNFDFTA